MKALHPAAEIFDPIEGPSFDELVNDIRAHGVHEPITLHTDGRILDGRNRARACEVLGIEPTYRTWDGIGSAVAYVVSLNLRRRHLDESQRALVAARIANLEHGVRADTSIEVSVTQPEAAAMLNVGTASVQRARQVLDHGTPELVQAVSRGEVAVSTAAVLTSLPAPQQRQVVARGEDEILSVARQIRQQRRDDRLAQTPATRPTPIEGRYRVIYADPPWSYGNSGVITDTDAYGRAARHYPSMSIEELCALPIAQHAESNAVLFLWVTSPLLAECWPVIESWGFKYKTSMVWDKLAHNYGHYVSVRHELLLICTRGSCLPDRPTPMPNSVQSIARSDRHSEKPEEFRALIEHLYDGPRVELFARAEHEGWVAWGNQVEAAVLV